MSNPIRCRRSGETTENAGHPSCLPQFKPRRDVSSLDTTDPEKQCSLYEIFRCNHFAFTIWNWPETRIHLQKLAHTVSENPDRTCNCIRRTTSLVQAFRSLEIRFQYYTNTERAIGLLGLAFPTLVPSQSFCRVIRRQSSRRSF